MPHVTKVARKPKGVGCELKSVADGKTCIMLRLEIQEGAEVMPLKRFVKRTRNRIDALDQQYHADEAAGLNGKHHTALTLRLVYPWKNTFRIVVADSAFASVETLIALRRIGLYFIGMVKTASVMYPLKYLNNWANDPINEPERGSHCVLSANYATAEGQHIMLAIGWKDLRLKTIIASCGLTTPGNDAVRPRHHIVDGPNNLPVTERVELRVKRPKVVETLFEAFSAVDVQDHYRQGNLDLEGNWLTKCWYDRVFTTVFGIIVTDMYLAYKYYYLIANNGNKSDMDSFHYFCDQVAYYLIFNPVRQNVATKRRASSSIEPTVDEVL